MRDRIERFVLLPFSLGCVSESSIAVGSDQHQFRNRSKRRYSNSAPTSIPEEEDEEEEEEEEEDEEEEDEESSSEENLKSFLSAPKFQRLFKNFKNISQLFVYKDEDDEGEEEEEVMGMEIGFPTDVKHVTHIGIDGSTTSILSKGWEHNLKQPQFNIQGPSDHETTKAPNNMKMMNL